MDAFDIEKYRTFLARSNDLEGLLATYSKSYPFIKNINTSKFWGAKFKTKEEKGQISFVEDDRILTVYKYLQDKTGKMLDLGFGQGKLESLLFSGGSRLSLNGVDISAFAVKRAKLIFGGNFWKGAIKEIPCRPESFDYLVAMEILEHIPPFEILETLTEMVRVLKRSGVLVISVPLNEDLEKMITEEKLNPNGHTRIYTPDLLRAELNIVGLKVVREVYLYAFSDFYSLKKALMNIFPNLKQPNNVIVFAQRK